MVCASIWASGDVAGARCAARGRGPSVGARASAAVCKMFAANMRLELDWWRVLLKLTVANKGSSNH